MYREGGVCSSGLNLSVIAARCHLPYRGGHFVKLRLFARGSPTRGNGDDRRQRRKQGVAVGAAASRMQAAAQQTLGAATRPCLRSRLRGCTKDSLPIIQKRPRDFFRGRLLYYTTKHHSGVVMSDSTVEMAVHLLAKVESAPYFSARMVVVPPIGIPARTTATPVASWPTWAARHPPAPPAASGRAG